MSSDNEAASVSGHENEEYDEVRDMRLAAALRKAVHDTFAKDPDYVTVRNIRTMVEDDLDLGKEWFKNDETWRSKSKEIIEAEAHIENSRAEAEREQLDNSKKGKAPAKRKAVPKKAAAPKKNPAPKKKSEELLDSDDEEEEPKPVKRVRAGNTTAATKKAKTTKVAPKTKAKADDSDSSMLSDLSEDDLDLEPPAKKSKATPKKSTPAKPAANESFEVQVASPKSPRSPKITKVAKEEKADPEVKLGIDSGDESEMSEVFDETPKKKGRGKAAGSAKAKKEKPAPKPKAKKASGLSPDEEKVKTLQGWLIKCGIRKLWHRELANCETPKEKQAHLRKMLADAGMEPPYSQQRAKKIKEERELAAELASIQQVAPSPNDSDDDDGDVKTRSRAPAAPAGSRRSRGLASINYFDNDDDESDST